MAPAFDFEGVALRHKIKLDLAKMPLLQKVFDRVCTEAGIFPDARTEQEALATQLLTSVIASEEIHVLVEEGHSALRRIRQRK